MSKRILFCADGTWNDAATNTNVYKIFKAIKFNAQQCPIYDDGVGSDGNTLLRLVGGAFGNGLYDKIKEGYTRIGHLYEKGDQVFLFGFSRGAFTARALGGMIALCGLPTQNVDDQMVELAFDAYRERDKTQRPKMLSVLKQRYAMDEGAVTMIGVWDTVGALGIPAIFGGVSPLIYGFCDTTLHPSVKHAYHAVSIDERRNSFPATLWTGPFAPDQTVEQVYFTGVHCDVGGGYPECGLSDITLSWIMRKANALGVEFEDAVWKQYENVDMKHSLDQKHESWSPKWLVPNTREIADDACLSNSAKIRVQCDASYKPENLKHNAGQLAASYKILEVVELESAAAAAGGTTPIP